jgi:predicted N-acetyltransferase YhbS
MTRQITTRFSFRSIERRVAPIGPHFRIALEKDQVAKTTSGALIGTIRLWPIFAGQGRASLLLGPLAVCPNAKDGGVGRALMLQALARAKVQGHASILLVGDAAYYKRFGFEQRFTDRLLMPGPVDAKRFLGRELIPGALSGAAGAVTPARHQHLTAIAA